MAATARNNFAQDAVSHDAESDGRAYHEDTSSVYVLPKDAKEHVRLEGQARMMETLMGGEVFHAPVDEAKVTKVLDIGCGTGYVTDKLARKFPKAAVYGLDLSPVPVLREQLSNIEYLQGNALTQKPTVWTGPGRTVFDQDQAVFDYIFSRLLVMGMTDWPGLLKQEFAMLKPGGYVEHHETDLPIYNAKGEVVHAGMLALTKALGIDHKAGFNLKERLEDAGFVDVVVQKYHLPWGGGLETDPTMKEVGDFWYRDVCEAFEESVKGALRKLSKPAAEAKAQIDEFHATHKPDVGNYNIVYAVYGRKP